MSDRAREAVHTYGTYRSWPGEERWELLGGQAHAMTPAPGLLHQTVVTELLTQIHTRLRGQTCKVFCSPFDVRLPRGDEPDEEIVDVVKPDLVVVCDPRKLDEKGCRGAPDWVIEILSPGSAGRDQIEKLALYEQHGVREYWIVHPVDRVVTVYQLEDRGVYGRPDTSVTRGQLGSLTLPDLAMDWDLVFGGLPDPTSG